MSVSHKDLYWKIGILSKACLLHVSVEQASIRHSAKVTVWYEIYSHTIIENEEGRTVTINAERYKLMLETFLRTELHPRQ
jgi:hypothetical protein